MNNHNLFMLRHFFILLLSLFVHSTFAQIHPHTHQPLQEVLEYEHSLPDSYPVFLAVPEGLDEAQPLHFYQSAKGEVARLSTYYFSRADSLVTKTLHQWGNFDALFQPNTPWSKDSIEKLRDTYKNIQEDLAYHYGTEVQVFKEESPNTTMQTEAIRWKTPLLYDPILEYRELERGEAIFGVITLAYMHQIWEETVIKQLDFLQYYFISKVQQKDYKTAFSLLSSELREEVKQVHLQELESVLSQYKVELFNSKEGFSDVEREYVFMFRLVDEAGDPHYTMHIAFNNNQDIIFLQYQPI